MNDRWEQFDAPVKSQSRTLIAHRCLLSGTVTPEQRRIKRLCCYCLVDPLWVHRKREQAWGVWMFLSRPAGRHSLGDAGDRPKWWGHGCWNREVVGVGEWGQIPLKLLLLQETTEGEWLWLTMWLSGEEFGLLPDDEGLPLFLICSQVSPSALAKWSSTEPVMDTELVAVGSGSL